MPKAGDAPNMTRSLLSATYEVAGCHRGQGGVSRLTYRTPRFLICVMHRPPMCRWQAVVADTRTSTPACLITQLVRTCRVGNGGPHSEKDGRAWLSAQYGLRCRGPGPVRACAESDTPAPNDTRANEQKAKVARLAENKRSIRRPSSRRIGDSASRRTSAAAPAAIREKPRDKNLRHQRVRKLNSIQEGPLARPGRARVSYFAGTRFRRSAPG